MTPTPTLDALQAELREAVSGEVRLIEEGLRSYRILLPFTLPDGDGLAAVLRRTGDTWELADEGNTFMRLSYTMDDRDLREGTRARVISDTLRSHGLTNDDGELRLPVPEGRFGPAVFEYAQALLRLHDLRMLSRERVRSTFTEDFRQLMVQTAPEFPHAFDWHDPLRDDEGHYKVDCRIKGDQDVMVFALPNDDKVRDATISILKLQSWGHQFRSVGIYEQIADLSRHPAAMLMDVVDKQFSSLEGNRDGIAPYIAQLAHA